MEGDSLFLFYRKVLLYPFVDDQTVIRWSFPPVDTCPNHGYYSCSQHTSVREQRSECAASSSQEPQTTLSSISLAVRLLYSFNIPYILP